MGDGFVGSTAATSLAELFTLALATLKNFQHLRLAIQIGAREICRGSRGGRIERFAARGERLDVLVPSLGEARFERSERRLAPR